MESCATCRFWEKGRGDAGACQRHPPVVVFTGGEWDSVRSEWPWTESGEWCGEWVDAVWTVPIQETRERKKRKKA